MSLMLGAGLVSNGPTGGGIMEEGIGTILIGAFLGAFGGLLFGLLSTHLLRFCFFCFGRHFSGSAITFVSMVLGAAVCAWMAAGDGE
jgi:hypothetical protein